MAFSARRDELRIGDGDLCIDASLGKGSSELENSYGIGLLPGSPEALCLLAGKPFFRIDQLEVWAILS